MSYADRLQHWNRLYDQAPEDLRFHVVVWGVVAIGALNMLLTVSVGFLFGLLFLFALLALVAIRGPYTAGWLKPPAEGPMLAGNSGGAPLLHQESVRSPAVEHQPAPEHAPEHTPDRALDPVRRD